MRFIHTHVKIETKISRTIYSYSRATYQAGTQICTFVENDPCRGLHIPNAVAFSSAMSESSVALRTHSAVPGPRLNSAPVNFPRGEEPYAEDSCITHMCK